MILRFGGCDNPPPSFFQTLFFYYHIHPIQKKAEKKQGEKTMSKRCEKIEKMLKANDMFVVPCDDETGEPRTYNRESWDRLAEKGLVFPVDDPLLISISYLIEFMRENHPHFKKLEEEKIRRKYYG
jgi:hypothetical protein|tara:strand:+ start:505 stop:882 length:378 start_codon:yes stop_codon:yes gene_type:complete